MAYPSGSGSERIRTGAIHNQTDDSTSFKFDGTNPVMGTETDVVPAHHIITILTIVFCEQANSTKTFWVWAVVGGNEIKFNQNVSIGPYETYVWNEKIVLHPADKLLVSCAASSNIDVFYTYIDQNWE